MNLEQQYGRLREYLSKKHLKSTRQRDLIVRVFLESKHEHFRIEDLHAHVRKIDPKVGYATVYRTLLLLKDAGLALHRHFEDGQSRFEQVSDEHHDHLICTECQDIIEFTHEEIEKLQDEVAGRYHFKLTGHRMELYGLCERCQNQRQ